MKVFKEEQRFTQPWLVILISIAIIILTSVIIKAYIAEDSNMRAVEVVTIIASIIASIMPLFFLKLKTRIDETGIHYQFSPFHRKFRSIDWQHINNAYVRKYNPISEYGGWGIKHIFWRKHGKAFNISGNIGIQLELKNGKRILIGTLKESEARSVLETYKIKK